MRAYSLETFAVNSFVDKSVNINASFLQEGLTIKEHVRRRSVRSKISHNTHPIAGNHECIVRCHQFKTQKLFLAGLLFFSVTFDNLTHCVLFS